MIAAVVAARSGLFRREQWLPNIIAGIVVGVVALPLAMAFAIASGVKPEQGIYTAIVAGAIVSAFGGSRVQIAGPTGAFVVILAGVTARYGVDGLLLASLMAGVILIAMGVARLGGVIRYIPAPVIAGFTAGIGVIIWVGQWKDFFGLPAPQGTHFHLKLWHLLQSLPGAHPATTALAILSLVGCIFGPRLPGLGRVPGPLIAMVLATMLQAILGFEGVATIGSAFGGIPQGLPFPHLPLLSLAQAETLLPSAFAIAMLGAIESLLSAVVADGMSGSRHDSNQELIGQGIANVIAPLFGGFAATGAIARTATNVRNGGTSPLAGLFHAFTLAAILLVLAPLAAHIPLCALSAILFVVAWNMSDVPHFIRMARTAPKADIGILLTTFLLTVFADLVVAVNVGVALAIIQFLRRMAASVEVRRVDDRALASELGDAEGHGLPSGTQVFEIEGPLFFGAVESLEKVLRQTHSDPRCLIVRLGRVPFIDATGLQALEGAVDALERRGIQVVFCEASGRVLGKLVRAGIVGRHAGNRRYSGDLAHAAESCRQTQPLAQAIA